MMTSLQKGIIILAKSAITGKAYDLPDGFSLEDAVNIAKEHQIINLIYYGALNCGFKSDDTSLIKLFNIVCSNILRNERQSYEFNRITNAFSESGLDFLPLKGIDIRNFYPKQDMRTMGDIDILIKKEQYDAISAVMTELGYNCTYESNHEYIWRNGNIIMELHKRLVPSYNKDYYNYYGEGWDFAKSIGPDSCLFKMSDEDSYIYLFTHFAKHYRDGGIGIRHLVDLWVCRSKYGNLDFDYINTQLNKLHLREFYYNVSKTIDVLFENGESDELSEAISKFIFDSGPYGDEFRYLISSRLKNSHKSIFGEAVEIVFLPAENMKREFPVLNKAPFLLPVFWAVRGFRTLFFRKSKIKQNAQKLLSVSDVNVKEYNEFLKYVGLGFYKK